jgi:L-threonylcarbamoyladenylate synthase
MGEIKTELIPTHKQGVLQKAKRVLDSGGVVAFPTDTVYGIGAVYSNPEAVLKLYRAKERPGDKAIPVLGSGLDAFTEVAAGFNQATLLLAEAFWPGPLTLLVQRSPSVPVEVTPFETVAVRVPDMVFTRELLSVCGPLAVTSANLSGGESPCTAQEVLADLDGRVDLILDGGRTPGGVSSTILDCTREKPVLLREGPVSIAAIEKILK